MKRLVLIGGGHAHVEVLRRFGVTRVPETEIVLISAGRYTAYSGMLPGLIAGHYAWREAHIDLEPLAHFAGAQFLTDIAVGLDLDRRVVRCAHAEVPYDWVALDIGSVPNTHTIEQADKLGLLVRPVEQLLAGVEGLLHDTAERSLHLVVVGAGAGGVELCLAMQYRLARFARHAAQFSIVTLSEHILPGYGAGARRRMQRVLKERAIEVRTRSRVIGIADSSILLESGEKLRADRVVWATGPAAASWVGQSGLHTDTAGFVLVNDYLQSVSHPEVFAAGDVATMVNHPHPKSGVYAVRQGPPLAENLRRIATSEALVPYIAQKRALQLITTGDRYAIAAWDGMFLEGGWVWQWKDWIDRGFVRRYGVAPEAPAPA